MDWMLLPLKRYADFSGRSRRKEYWLFTLFHTIVVLATIGMCVAAIVATSRDNEGLSAVGVIAVLLGFAVVLALFIPSLAAQVRRFHDQDKSGWFVLLGLIPSIGGLIVLVMMCLEGTPGPNRFGPDPKAGEFGH